MNQRQLLGWAAAAAALTAGACSVATPDPVPPTYNLSQDRFVEGSPDPIALAGEIAAAPMKEATVKIEPETSVGFDQLPTSVTQLFDGPVTDLNQGRLVELTLANERGLTIQGYSLRFAEYEVPVQKGIYDLAISAGSSFTRTELQNSPGSFLNQRERLAFTQLSQLLPSGATVTGSVDLARRTSLNDFINDDDDLPDGYARDYQGRATLEIVQPLLRGFGEEVTNARIRIAEAGAAGASADFQTNLEQTLLNVLNLYWDLTGAIENYKVRTISYSAARDLLRVNTAKFDAGVLPQTDVFQAQAAADSRLEELLRARQTVRDIEDELKRRIFLQSGEPQWPTQIRPSQPIGWRELRIDQDKTIALALTGRSELRRAVSAIEQSRLNRNLAENAKKPALNVFAQAQANGLDRSLDGAVNTTADGDFVSYNAGIDFQYPLQNRTARYREKQAQAQLLQDEERLRQLREQITLEVRQAIRALHTARERIDATLSGVASEEEKLRSQRQRYDVGIATAFEVLSFQDDLAAAQAQFISAVVDYNKAALALERSRGTLLDTYGVSVSEIKAGPQPKASVFPVGWN